MKRLKEFILQVRRVLLVASKPDKNEYKMSIKITGIGIILVGLIGFIVFMVVQAIRIFGGAV